MSNMDMLPSNICSPKSYQHYFLMYCPVYALSQCHQSHMHYIAVHLCVLIGEVVLSVDKELLVINDDVLLL